MLTNYHTHCYLDDGKGRPQEYIEQAIARGFDALGFSCHAPLPYANEWALRKEDLDRYLSEIKTVREEAGEKLEVYLGLEIDYIPGIMGPSDDSFQRLGLDYRIGSVHSLKDEVTGEELSIDNTPEDLDKLLEHSYQGDIRRLCRDYFDRQIGLLQNHSFDILGHCDLVRKLNKDNRFFDPRADWYLAMAEDLLQAASEAGVIVEVNTGAIARGYTTEFYPSHILLKKARERKIPITLNADAHLPEKISESFTTSRSIIREAGYRTLMHLVQGEWRESPV